MIVYLLKLKMRLKKESIVLEEVETEIKISYMCVENRSFFFAHRCKKSGAG